MKTVPTNAHAFIAKHSRRMSTITSCKPYQTGDVHAASCVHDRTRCAYVAFAAREARRALSVAARSMRLPVLGADDKLSRHLQKDTRNQ